MNAVDQAVPPHLQGGPIPGQQLGHEPLPAHPGALGSPGAPVGDVSMPDALVHPGAGLSGSPPPQELSGPPLNHNLGNSVPFDAPQTVKHEGQPSYLDQNHPGAPAPSALSNAPPGPPSGPASLPGMPSESPGGSFGADQGTGTPVSFDGGNGNGMGGNGGSDGDDPSLPPPPPPPQPLPPPVFNMPPMGLPVHTPGVSPDLFPFSQEYRRAERVPAIGAGAQGVDRFARILMSLMCAVEPEVNWGLSALLELSFASPDAFSRDKIRGQPILSLVSSYVLRRWPWNVNDESYAALERMQKVLEALLILRNASLDAPTAQFLAPRCAEIVERGLQLPRTPEKQSFFGEMRMLCMEIAEHICFYLTPHSPDSVLFSGLVEILNSGTDDRGLLVCALRSLARLSVADQRDCILSLSTANMHALYRYLLLGDEESELVSAALDVLYQYTARIQSVDQLIGNEQWVKQIIGAHLVRLLAFKIDKEPQDYLRLPRRSKKPIPVEPPPLPDSLLRLFLVMDEPERALSWIRSTHEPDPEAEVTQVSLWNGYQSVFEPHARNGAAKRLLRAIDYIRQASNAFPNAEAAVVTTPSGEKKFIIKGLKPREKAINPRLLTLTPVAAAPKRRRVTPPVFGPTAALVLQNISKLRGGPELLRPLMPEVAEAATLNKDILGYVDGLLDVL